MAAQRDLLCTGSRQKLALNPFIRQQQRRRHAGGHSGLSKICLLIAAAANGRVDHPREDGQSLRIQLGGLHAICIRDTSPDCPDASVGNQHVAGEAPLLRHRHEVTVPDQQ